MPDSSAPPIKRACDACHRRKVKCIGEDAKSCKNCSQAGLKCTYNAVPQKKGPKGCRAKVISELRETQRQTPYRRSPEQLSPTLSPGASRGPSSLPPDLIESCIDFFFTNMYPTQPILSREGLQQTVSDMNHSVESYCLVSALCAYMMIQPNMPLPPHLLARDVVGNNAGTSLASRLLGDALELRKSSSYVENPTPDSVVISFFFFGCYFCLEKHNTAWFHLREATTLALFLGMHQESTYRGENTIELELRRRLFWLLFVTERAYALQAQRPLTLHATISLPDVRKDPREAVELTGFIHLIQLFKPFDDTFVGLWNQSLEECNATWLKALQQQLADALPKYLDSTETQAVDLRTSQHWLRIMVWQLSISHRLLSSTSADESMTFRYPVDLSRELLADTSRFSQEAMEVHGIGLIKKLFDVACTLIDVMACVPIEQAGFELGPRDFLNHFLHLLSKLRGGQDRYLPLLIAKANDTLPNLPSSSIPHGLPSSFGGRFEEVAGASLPVTAAMVQPAFDTSLSGSLHKTEFGELMDNSPYVSAPATISPYGSSTPTGESFSPHESSYSG